jgi:hypothetical protein
MPLLLVLCLFVALAYWVRTGRKLTARGAALLLSAVAVWATYDAGMIAVREYDSAQHGRVQTGIVVKKLSSTGADGSERLRSPRSRRSRRLITTEGFKIHDVLARLIFTGSTNAWVIEYRYSCDQHPCRARDFVPETLWRELHNGQTVNVRRSNGSGSRLDANPPWTTAIANMAIAAALLLAAGLVSGGLTVRLGRRYVSAPAVVTAIEPVKYRDVTRWRIRFSYVDPDGNGQEGVDEVVTDAWQPGDACLAVFPLEQPGLAGFRALDA